MLDNRTLKRLKDSSLKAQQLLSGNTVILDTETTGISRDSEIVELAILSINGDVLFNSFIKPQHPIDPRAIAVHGITDEMVANAPSFTDIAEQVYRILKDKTIVAHNVVYDTGRLNYEFGRAGYDGHGASGTACTMLLSMEYDGQRWKKLAATMKWLGIEHKGESHRALYDTQCCHLVLKGLAELNP